MINRGIESRTIARQLSLYNYQWYTIPFSHSILYTKKTNVPLRSSANRALDTNGIAIWVLHRRGSSRCPIVIDVLV